MSKILKKWMVQVVIILFLTGCSSNQANAFLTTKQVSLLPKQEIPANFFPRELKVVSIGDSLTQGIGDSTNSGGYIPHLTQSFNSLKEIKSTEFINLGKKGLKTSGLLKQLEDSSVREEIEMADIVMITIGGNDLMSVIKRNFTSLTLELFSTESSLYQERLTTVLTKIRHINQDAGIVLIGIYNPFLFLFSKVPETESILKDWNAVSERTVINSVENAFFVNIADLFMNIEEKLLSDDFFHPNDLGYQRISERVFEFLSKGNRFETLIENSLIKNEE
ncbi:GDSL-type esterase/lipase family protein [Bacillus spongiae]|uniref:GDSL-type esterase/lipase family protein n=1 Tax=Bacillus spongiae TaxID=2683610 RepID=A0ABU8HDP7_9BACI